MSRHVKLKAVSPENLTAEPSERSFVAADALNQNHAHRLNARPILSTNYAHIARAHCRWSCGSVTGATPPRRHASLTVTRGHGLGSQELVTRWSTRHYTRLNRHRARTLIAGLDAHQFATMLRLLAPRAFVFSCVCARIAQGGMVYTNNLWFRIALDRLAGPARFAGRSLEELVPRCLADDLVS